LDALAYHLLLQLIRRGDIGQSDVDEMAARLEAEGEKDRAHAVRAAVVEATLPDEAEWRRSKIKLIHDGGNETG
jgi:hypothetical protein